MEKEITLQQALEAEKYVDSYIQSLGGDPASVRSKEGYEKTLPPDVKKALETSREFWRKKEEEGITL